MKIRKSTPCEGMIIMLLLRYCYGLRMNSQCDNDALPAVHSLSPPTSIFCRSLDFDVEEVSPSSALSHHQVLANLYNRALVG